MPSPGPEGAGYPGEAALGGEPVMTAGEETVSAGRTELETPLYGENSSQIHIYAEAAKRAICCGPNNNDNNNNRENGAKPKRQRGLGRTGQIRRQTEAGESSRQVLPHRLLAVRDLTGGEICRGEGSRPAHPTASEMYRSGSRVGLWGLAQGSPQARSGRTIPHTLLIPEGSALVCIPRKTL